MIRSADPSMFEDVSDDETTTADISEIRDFDQFADESTGRKANPVKVNLYSLLHYPIGSGKTMKGI